MDIEVARPEYSRTRIMRPASGPLDEGQARLRIDKFGLSANNVTYAVVGDMLSYWDFFPASPSDDDTRWGRVPVWGFADVIESRSDGLAVGERLFGYLPMSEELVITVGEVNDSDFVAERRKPREGAPAGDLDIVGMRSNGEDIQFQIPRHIHPLPRESRIIISLVLPVLIIRAK